MGMYYEIVAANSRAGDDKKMWASVKQVDGLLERMKEHHPDVYDGFINETINLFYDKHFDEMLGEMIVDKMYHCEREGSDKHKVQGEHYSIDYARKVRSEFKDMPYNEWDWYVLLNMIYHDNICMLMEWWPSEESYNSKVIAMAVNYITDDDATETKLWDRYIK